MFPRTLTECQTRDAPRLILLMLLFLRNLTVSRRLWVRFNGGLSEAPSSAAVSKMWLWRRSFFLDSFRQGSDLLSSLDFLSFLKATHHAYEMPKLFIFLCTVFYLFRDLSILRFYIFVFFDGFCIFDRDILFNNCGFLGNKVALIIFGSELSTKSFTTEDL